MDSVSSIEVPCTRDSKVLDDGSPRIEASRSRQAADLLRACVHCGFCNSACPTYKVTGDELDGPRGRLYLIGRLIEGQGSPQRALRHLDRCLTCRACEGVCPSGVRYARLLDYGRERVEATRPLRGRLLRRLLCLCLGSRRFLAPGVAALRVARPLLPGRYRRLLPPRTAAARPVSRSRERRRMLLFEGCVQPVLAPSINLAAARLFGHLGIAVPRVRGEGCCGALHYHLGFPRQALRRARANLDAWWPWLQGGGADALVVTASGCAAMIRDYPRLLKDEPDYAGRAAVAAGLLMDPVQVLADLELSGPRRLGRGPRRVALHVPCTQAHALALPTQVGELMQRMGFELTPNSSVGDCCGSAGAYSLLHPRMAGALRTRRLEALTVGQAQCIATANIGCLLHLRRGTPLPVLHWLELLAPLLDR